MVCPLRYIVAGYVLTEAIIGMRQVKDFVSKNSTLFYDFLSGRLLYKFLVLDDGRDVNYTMKASVEEKKKEQDSNNRRKDKSPNSPQYELIQESFGGRRNLCSDTKSKTRPISFLESSLDITANTL